MKNLIGVLLVAAVATGASAQVSQRSQFEIELSTNGTNWTNALEINPAITSRVFARVHVTYIANGGPTPLFFNGGRSQPTGAGWDSANGDTVLAFNPTGRVVADFGATPTLGRVFGATTVSAVAAHQYAFGGTNYLRFAETAATNHPGQGSGTNNVTGGAGINTSNNTLSPQLGSTNSPSSCGVWTSPTPAGAARSASPSRRKASAPPVRPPTPRTPARPPGSPAPPRSPRLRPRPTTPSARP
ncbi:MAG: hypothetical protein ACOYN0_11375 [Phycisphaerales bacterium]